MTSGSHNSESVRLAEALEWARDERNKRDQLAWVAGKLADAIAEWLEQVPEHYSLNMLDALSAWEHIRRDQYGPVSS